MPEMREQFLEAVATVRRVSAEVGLHMNRIRARCLAVQMITDHPQITQWADPTGEEAVRRVLTQQAVAS